MQIKIKRAAVVAAAGAAALAAAALVPTAAFAASGYTVSPGGTVKATNPGTLTFVDQTSTSKPKLTCPKGNFVASGTAKKGSHAFVPKTYKSATGLSAAGSLTKISLKNCSNAITGKATITPSGTWSLGFSSKSSTGGTGYLYNVTAKVSAAGCSFTSKGAVYGKYANKTGVFAGTTQPGLVLSSVSGANCALVGVANGDKAYLQGNVKLSPIQTIK